MTDTPPSGAPALPPPRPGSVRATVTWVGNGYVHAIDDHGQTYFVFHNAIEQTGRWTFDDLWIGSKVILTPIQHPTGWRGLDVQIVEI